MLSDFESFCKLSNQEKIEIFRNDNEIMRKNNEMMRENIDILRKNIDIMRKYNEMMSEKERQDALRSKARCLIDYFRISLTLLDDENVKKYLNSLYEKQGNY